MKNIWAPWRMVYIGEVDSGKGCFFCRVLKADCDEANLVVWRSRHTFCIMNRFPYNNGHLLIAPRRHEAHVEGLTHAEQCALMKDTVRAQKVLAGVMSPQGFNWGLNVGRAGGAGVEDHLHMHIVPRWVGDTNFMPVFADVKVIPQALEELYSLLRRQAAVTK